LAISFAAEEEEGIAGITFGEISGAGDARDIRLTPFSVLTGIVPDR
jgi:hypothetical protein